MAGRKGNFRPPSAEIARAYGDAVRKSESLERDLEERTKWAMSLRKEKEAALADFQRAAAQDEEAARHIQHLEKNLAEARAARAKIESSFWTRVGRKLGAI
jgi:septal ring factor EnvC (AmiA/AmiB activator)